MNRLWRFALALLPVCLLSAQQSTPPNPSTRDPHSPSPEFMRQITEKQQQMRQHSIAINEVAGHIQSLDDARKLVNMIAGEFPDGLPPKWATRSYRERIARAEYESVTDPRALIPEQHIADVWNDFVEKIGAPPETLLSAAEVHYVRDAQYVSARLLWSRDQQQLWTIPGIFAAGSERKIASGARAIEAIRLLWLLGSLTEDFPAIHTQVQKGTLVSDLIPDPEAPPKPGSFKGRVSLRTVSYPVQQAAIRYAHDHGNRAMNHVLENLFNQLLAG